ncbi:MAG: Hpt domain-containing protein [Candidatus Omnitrophica bacterium]|nr:Hpt domain-containing protein [Candidatus Omnitrophota bacterium]
MDKKEILNELGGLPEDVYDELVLIFWDETRGRLKDMTQAVLAHDWTAVDRLAHGIKGSAANLRLTTIRDVAKEMQEAAKANDQPQVSRLFEFLKSLIPN